uniref:Uncharacterized protein n=1 Tax=Anguilla anguilla TaxID=7936 RepID=A0A0E9PSC3_ANGAN
MPVSQHTSFYLFFIINFNQNSSRIQAYVTFQIFLILHSASLCILKSTTVFGSIVLTETARGLRCF